MCFSPSLLPFLLINNYSELIGEEIYDETDPGGAKGTYVHHHKKHHHHHHHHPAGPADKGLAPPAAAGGMRNFFRSRSVPPAPRDGPEVKPASAPQTPLIAPTPLAETLPSILKDGADMTTSPQPEPATVEFAANTSAGGVAREAPTRSNSLPPGTDVTLEAVLRAGAGRRGRPGAVTRAATTTGPRGIFKSSPIDGTKGETKAEGEPATSSTPATVAAAIPIDEGQGTKRTLEPQDIPIDTAEEKQ